MERTKQTIRSLCIMLVSIILLSQSTLKPADATGRVRAFTRMIEFDFVEWTLDALMVKNVQGALNVPQYMSLDDQRRVVFEYLDLVRRVNRTTAQIEQIYADPEINDPGEVAAELNENLKLLQEQEDKLKPFAEAVLQYQVSATIAEMGLSVGGQPFPPVLYHATRLPYALIISPRDTIRQDANISLVPQLTTEEMVRLETAVEEALNVSALVVPIGGVGTYPTMVLNSTNLEWLVEVISHEWTHNFLTLRPLGMQYMASGETRTMNETTANIAGKEIGRALLERYYPELAPPPEPPEEEAPESASPVPPEPEEEDPNVFDFNREMRKTRVRADELLAAGKIEEAEEYMEERRRFFWAHGYQIRRLNQAYFAFHGAYADDPGGGAAGGDPVGPAVQELRRHSPSLAAFLNRIAWITSFDGLLRALEQARAQSTN